MSAPWWAWALIFGLTLALGAALCVLRWIAVSTINTLEEIARRR